MHEPDQTPPPHPPVTLDDTVRLPRLPRLPRPPRPPQRNSIAAGDYPDNRAYYTDPPRRPRSPTRYPKAPLPAVVVLARSLDALGGEASRIALAERLGQDPAMGRLATHVGAAMVFGVVSYAVTEPRGPRSLCLTNLGRRLAAPTCAAQDAQTAFDNVACFADMRATLGGGVPPIGVATAAFCERCDLTQASATRAARVYRASVAFLESLPPRADDPTSTSPPDTAPAALDPLLAALWGRLPARPPFPRPDKERWLTALGAALDVVYPDTH